MIRLSVNILTSVIILLQRLTSYQFSSISELTYTKITSISAEDVFEFAQNCGWVLESENALVLTPHGNDILRLHDQGLYSTLKRTMLMDYILKTSPIWSNRIPYGRIEAAIFMTKDEKACFVEAGLLSDRLNPGVIDWW